MSNNTEALVIRWRWKADEHSSAGRWSYVESEYFDRFKPSDDMDVELLYGAHQVAQHQADAVLQFGRAMHADSTEREAIEFAAKILLGASDD